MSNSPNMIAAIVVSWNQRELTLLTVRSLVESDLQDLHIIVVDNGSSDGSVEKLRGEFPKVQIIANQTNVGFATANNQGITSAIALGAQYVFLLNNDATVESNTISQLLELVQSSDKIGAVSPFIYYSNKPESIWYGGGVVALWRGWIGHRYLRKDRRHLPDGPCRTDYLTGCALLIRTEILKRLGGFDEDFTMYAEDVDLSLRLRKAGYELWVTPAASVYHQVSASAMGAMSPFKAFHRGRSTALLMMRWAKWYEWVTLVGIATGSMIFISLKLIIDRKPATVAGLWHGIISGLTGSDVPHQYVLKQN